MSKPKYYNHFHLTTLGNSPPTDAEYKISFPEQSLSYSFVVENKLTFFRIMNSLLQPIIVLHMKVVFEREKQNNL
jgi:hypothetical protein